MIAETRFWSQHQWWAIKDDASISLAGLTSSFAERVGQGERGGAHPKVFGGELQRWCRLLADTDWVRSDLDATATMLATNGVKTPHPDSESWTRVSNLLGEYAYPLARYSVSFVLDVHNRRPAAGAGHGSPIRECARGITKDVRATLVDPARIGGSVLRDRAGADEFVAEPERYRASDRKIAMRAYAQRLLQYEFDAGEDIELTNSIGDVLVALSSEFSFSIDELRAKIKRPVAGLREDATRLTFQAALAEPSAQKMDKYDKLIERTIDSIEASLVKGEVLPDADLVFAQKQVDLEKEAQRPTAANRVVPVSPDDLAGLSDTSGGTAPTKSPAAFEQVEQQLLLEAAGKYLQDVEIRPYSRTGMRSAALKDFWEKSVAMKIIEGDTTVGWASQNALGTFSRTSVRMYVVAQWKKSGSQRHALCTNRDQAVNIVSGLLQLSIAHVLTTLMDFPDWIGRSDADERWSARISAVDRALFELREQTPQQLYDALKDGDNK